MAYRPVQWAKTTVSGRQDASDGSRLINFFAVRPVSPAPEDSKSPVILYGVPGLSVFHDAAALEAVGGTPEQIQGMTFVESPVYGNKLFCLARNGRLQIVTFNDDDTYSTALVPLPGEASQHPDSGFVRIATDGRYVGFVSAGEVFIYDQGYKVNEKDENFSPRFISVTAPTPDDTSDRTQTEDWVDIAWADGYFILASKGGQIFHSNLYSTQFDQLDFARPDYKQDGIVGMAVHSRLLYVFGTNTVELWYNAGTSDFAFRRDNSFTIDVGAVNPATIQQNEGLVAFLGSDLSVWIIAGRRLDKISNEVVDYAIAKSAWKNATAFTYTEEGHKFYSLNLFDDDGSAIGNWTFDFSTMLWHERTETNILSQTEAAGMNIVGLSNEYRLFSLSLDSATNQNGSPYPKRAISPIMYNRLNRSFVHRFDIDIDYVPPSDDPDYEAFVRLIWSDDGKNVWKGGSRFQKSISKKQRLTWRKLGMVDSVGRHWCIHCVYDGRITINGAFVQDSMQRSPNG